VSDYRPFQIRRTTGGDALRPDVADWQAPLRYGPRAVSPIEVEGTEIVAVPYHYDSTLLTVKVPADVQWTQAMMARGGFGFPTTPLDGVAVWYLAPKPNVLDNAGNPLPLARQTFDTPLTPGNFYYYSLFLWIGGQWVLSAQQDVLLPQDYGHSQLMMDAIPPYYVRLDDQRAADGRNGPLRLFASVLGYDLDYLRTLLDGVLNVYDPDRVPFRLMRYLGENMGFPYERTLGAARYRSILTGLLPVRNGEAFSSPGNLNNLRGTADGLQMLVTAASDYQCDAVQGNNMLLTSDDSEFVGGGPYYPTDPEYASTGVGLWNNLTDTAMINAISTAGQSGTLSVEPFDVPEVDPLAKPPITTVGVARSQKGDVVGVVPPHGRGWLMIESLAATNIVFSVGVHDATTLPVFKAVPVEPNALYDWQVDVSRTAAVPVSNVWTGVVWFGVDGLMSSLISATVGPSIPTDPDATAWRHIDYQFFAPANAYYAVPFVWWNTAAPVVRPFPMEGHQLAGAMFARIESAGGAVVPVPPDVLLTLGVTDKTIGEHPGGEYYLGDRT